MKMPSVYRYSLTTLLALAVASYSATPAAAEKAKRISAKTNGGNVKASAVKNTTLANSNFPELDTFTQELLDRKSKNRDL